MFNVHEFLSAQGDDYKKLSFKDLLFVHYQCPQIERWVKMYSHLNAIIYSIYGAKTYHSPDKSFTIREGECFFIKKGGYAQERFYDKDWLVMAFFMPDDYLKQVVKEYRTSSLQQGPLPEFPRDIVISLNTTDMTKGFFDSMLPYFLQKPQPAGYLVELKYRELVFSLLADPANSGLLSYIDHISDNRQRQLEEIMEANYMYNLSLSEYARISQRSLATFKREFTRQFKTTPGKWLSEKRLRYARLLLDTTQKNINEIADESGFENTTHFSRVFKEKFGESPLRYRRKNTNEADA